MDKLCRHCGTCITACPSGALEIKNAQIYKNHQLCKSCGKCVQLCDYGAMTKWGYQISADELVNKLAKDMMFYRTSGGGATISGGEPTMQFSFLINILEKLGNCGIHRTVDTNGYCDPDQFRYLLTKTEHILFDIKGINPERHKKNTGVRNTVILKNLEMLLKSEVKFNIRYPMIPELNDSEEEIKEMCCWLKEHHVDTIDVSVFHDFYTEKYRQMFREEQAPLINKYTKTEVDEKLALIKKHGINGIVV